MKYSGGKERAAGKPEIQREEGVWESERVEERESGV